MRITVYIHSNNAFVIEIPDGTEAPLAGNNNSQLSVEERLALLDKFAAKFTELVGSDVPPLSDYAVSREGIYEDHP